MVWKVTKLFVALVAPLAVSDADYLNVFFFPKFFLVGFAQPKTYALDVLHEPLVLCIQ